MEMDAEKEEEEEEDPFASMIKLCEPTASQEAKFPNCPFARESDPDNSSSSPDPTPSDPVGIVMISLPSGSSASIQDEAAPPEHPPHSSEEQNLPHGLSVRVSEAELPEAKRIRVSRDEFDGSTEVIEMEGNDDAEVIVLDSGDSGATVNLGEDSLAITTEGGIEVGTIDVVQKNGDLMNGVAPKVDAINGNHDLGMKCKALDVNIGEKHNANSDLSGSSDSGKIEEEIVEIKNVVGDRCIEVRQKSGDGGNEKVVKITKDVKMPKEYGHQNEGLKTNGKRIEEIDEFRYVGDGDRRWKEGTSRAVGGSGRRRRLPVSFKGKEKDVGGSDVEETVEAKSGLLDFLDVLKVIFGNTDGEDEDMDFLKTAKKRGLTFPKPRWWQSEDDDDDE